MIQLQLSAASEEQLRKAAQSHGQSVDEYATALLEAQAQLMDSSEQRKEIYYELPADQWIQKFKEWADSHTPNPSPLSDYAVSRDSMYD